MKYTMALVPLLLLGACGNDQKSAADPAEQRPGETAEVSPDKMLDDVTVVPDESAPVEETGDDAVAPADGDASQNPN